MKVDLKRFAKTIKSINGNSLAEFATVTALMATLAATAAPKLSEMSEGAKAQKSVDELDKLVKQAGQFTRTLLIMKAVAVFLARINTTNQKQVV